MRGASSGSFVDLLENHWQVVAKVYKRLWPVKIHDAAEGLNYSGVRVHIGELYLIEIKTG